MSVDRKSLGRACGALLLATALALASCAPKARGPEAKELRIYNWSDYIDQSILDDFTKETGIKVVYDTFDSADVLETKVMTGATGYDVVVPPNLYVTRFIEAGAIQPLDQTKLPNRKNLWPRVTALMAPFDPGAKYSVPYMWGTVGIGYNPAMVAKRLPGVKIDSWSVLFDPANLAKLKDCGVYFLADGQDMYGAVLRYQNHDVNSTNLADYQAATDLLMKLRPSVRKFDNSQSIEALANGDICVAIGYSGDMLQAADRAREAKHGVTVAYVIPKEGTQVWVDSFAVPKDAPHPDAAHRFIDYMMRPAVIAKASNVLHYANANLPAQPLMDKAILGDPNVYPTEEVFTRLYAIKPKDQALLREVNRQFTRVQTGQ